MSTPATYSDFAQDWIDYIHKLQDTICLALENEDGQARFREDLWQRTEGGGGKTRIIAGGRVFEKGGVNTSVVYGRVTPQMEAQLGVSGSYWFACGLSLVLHPLNPYVPTTHANWRYFEVADDNKKITERWFGGGADLTPYYLFEEDAAHFHRTLRDAIEPFGTQRYQQYKNQCDQYFNNAHRGFEMRGIGGVFYDHLKPGTHGSLEELFAFQKANGNSFLPAYLPLVRRRKNQPYGPDQRYWQEIRRGRYVEFNLIHDRGTLFGLKTNGRTESILMSLPPTVRFDYDFPVLEGSPEWKLLEACRHPQDWANLPTPTDGSPK